MNPETCSNRMPRRPGSLLVWVALGLSLVKGLGDVPVIVTQPRELRAPSGARAVFSVYASGSPAPTYSWSKDGMAVPAATNASLVLERLNFTDAGSYSVAVSNALGGTSSVPATLTVTMPQAGDLDYSFNPGSDFDDFATQVKLLPGGDLLVAGEFTTVHGAVRGRLARFKSDGSLEAGFLNGMSGADSNITCLAVQPDGNIIVAGTFNRFNGITRNRMARIRPDGSLDGSSFAGSNFWSSTISAVAVQPDGRILVGGSFTNLNGTIRNRLLRLTPAGTLDAEFLNGLSGASLSVLVILVQADNRIVVAGSFNTMNGVFHNRVAKLNPDGSLDASFVNDLATAPSISGAALQPDGKLLVGGTGAFVSSNGVSRAFLARLNTDGSLDTNFLSNLSGPVARVSRVFYIADKIFISGDFWEVNGQPRAGLACLNLDGSLDTSFFGSFQGVGGIYKTITDLVRDDAGGLVLAGAFTSINGVFRPSVGRLYADGTLDGAFMPGSGIDGAFVAAGLQPNGSVVVGGYFTNIGTYPCGNLARLHPNGSVDLSFQQSGVNGYVTTILPHGDARLTVAGTFTMADGWSRNRMARFNPDGSLDHSFLEAMTGFEFPRYSGEGIFNVALQADGKVIAGGDYGRVNGATRTNIARLNSDGTLDLGFASNTPNDWVKCVELQTNGGVLLGGYFTAINGKNRTGLARLQPDGTLDSGYTPMLLTGYGTAARIEVMALQPDGKLLLYGDIYTINGTLRPGLARLNSNGSLDTDFLKGMSGPDQSVSAIRVQPNGRILLGGQFRTINGIGRQGIARLNADGSVDPSFSGSITFRSVWQSISALCEQADGRILVAGNFSQCNGEAIRGIARLYGEAQPLPGLAIERHGTQVTVSWPSYYTGWKLQGQTLPSADGSIGTNWLAVTGSEITNRLLLELSAPGSAYFRLAQP